MKAFLGLALVVLSLLATPAHAQQPFPFATATVPATNCGIVAQNAINCQFYQADGSRIWVDVNNNNVYGAHFVDVLAAADGSYQFQSSAALTVMAIVPINTVTKSPANRYEFVVTFSTGTASLSGHYYYTKGSGQGGGGAGWHLTIDSGSFTPSS